MKTVKVKLSLSEDIKEFVKITNKYDFDIDLQSGRYVIDGKSILGIFSLDLTEPISVNIQCNECEDLVKELEPYTV